MSILKGRLEKKNGNYSRFFPASMKSEFPLMFLHPSQDPANGSSSLKPPSESVKLSHLAPWIPLYPQESENMHLNFSLEGLYG